MNNVEKNYLSIKDWFRRHPRLNPKSFTFDRAYRTITCNQRLLPDFIIAGYHKTATTFLYDYLIQHPNIGSASTKEIHFFDYSYWRGTNWYKAQFPLKKSKNTFEKKTNQPYKTGEATPLYTFHPKAVDRIKQLVPNVKIIIILRNPIERAYSHHQHKVRVGLEKMSFEDAIEDDERRLKVIMEKFEADEIQDYNAGKILFPYISMGKYIVHLKKWVESFPKEQMMILKTEHLNEDPNIEINKVCNFVGVPDYEFENISKKNVGNYSKMEKDVRDKLKKIYEPYNKELEKFLNLKFNWD